MPELQDGIERCPFIKEEEKNELLFQITWLDSAMEIWVTSIQEDINHYYDRNSPTREGNWFSCKEITQIIEGLLARYS